MSNIRKEKGLVFDHFVARKFYGSTGAVIEAKGETKEEAKANLKKACAEYRKKPLRNKKGPDGKDLTFFSPGYVLINNGLSVQHVYNPDRRGFILEANV